MPVDISDIQAIETMNDSEIANQLKEYCNRHNTESIFLRVIRNKEYTWIVQSLPETQVKVKTGNKWLSSKE